MRATLAAALLAAAAVSPAARAAPTPLYADAFAPGWSGAGYAPTSGVFNFSATPGHLGAGRAIRAQLAPFGTLVLRSAARDVGADVASLAMYVSAAGSATHVALGVSIATWLPGGASVPIASLCRVTQAARGAPLAAAAAAGVDAAGCAAGGADAGGWTRVTVGLDGFASAGWDEIQLSDVSGAGCTVLLDDAVLLRAADVAAVHSWDANAPYCAERMDAVLYGCTVPPSAECCADVQAFNANGCYCIANALLGDGAADMQLAIQYAAPDSCATRLMLPDDPRCFAAAPPPAGDGMPPLPEQAGPAQAAAVAPPPPAAARAPAPAPARGGAFAAAARARGTPAARDKARAAAPYVGIVAVIAAGTACAAAALRRRVRRALRDGHTEGSLLSEALLGQPLLR